MRKHRTSRRATFATLGAIIAIVCVFSALAAPVPAVVGDWNGALDTPNGAIRLILHVSQGQDGKLAGTLDSPDQGAAGIVITSMSYKDPDLHFEIDNIAASFDGKLAKDSSNLAGEWKFKGGHLPLNFKRASK